MGGRGGASSGSGVDRPGMAEGATTSAAVGRARGFSVGGVGGAVMPTVRRIAGSAQSVSVGDGPHSVEVSPDGTRVAVVNYISGDVSIIDPTTNAVVATVPAVGAGPQDVTYAPDGRHFYTANVDDGTMAVVDARSGVVTARIATGDSPTSIAVTPDGGRVFVTNFGDGTIRVLEGSVSP